MTRSELRDLWWVMHHSEDYESRHTAVITCYLDESGTHAASPVAVVGGLLLDLPRAQAFSEGWEKLLKKQGIDPPLHMKEFGRPHGKLARATDEQRRELLAEAAGLINAQKIASVAAALDVPMFDRHFRALFGSVMSLYGMSFILCAMLNFRVAQELGYGGRIAYLMDTGNPYAGHVREAHAEMRRHQLSSVFNAGALAFDRDDLVAPLEAADVIAWAARREMAKPLDQGFEPLAKILETNHWLAGFPESQMVELAGALQASIARGGEQP